MAKPFLTRRTHLFREDEYECSVCHAVFDRSFKECPNCKAKPSKTKYDPSWVTEMAEYDELIGLNDDNSDD